MELYIALILSFITLGTSTYAQHSWGILLNGNITTQTNFDPTKPQDGTFMWNWQQSISPGIYYKTTLSSKIKQRFSLAHNTKDLMITLK